MIVLRYLLFPFAILYGIITSARNLFFDIGILKSYSFPIPIIAVGNLSVGGTGKTPQIEYLIRLLSPQYKIATLSRGYKRKSSGFVLADAASTAEILGDEPYQMYLKFPEIHVAVDADRKNGIEKLLAMKEAPEVILLDDAFQHRRVRAGFYILLTTYEDLYCDDLILPTGTLRESRSGAKRADVIIVTKCPPAMTQVDKEKVIEKISLDIPVYFSSIAYDETVYNAMETKNVEAVRKQSKLLVAGIAKPQPFFHYLQSGSDAELEYADHHHFSESDVKTIQEKAGDRVIITTEKDFVRLKNSNLKSLFYLPIKSSFLSKADDFDQRILKYVSTKNPRI